MIIDCNYQTDSTSENRKNFSADQQRDLLKLYIPCNIYFNKNRYMHECIFMHSRVAYQYSGDHHTGESAFYSALACYSE